MASIYLVKEFLVPINSGDGIKGQGFRFTPVNYSLSNGLKTGKKFI